MGDANGADGKSGNGKRKSKGRPASAPEAPSAAGAAGDAVEPALPEVDPAKAAEGADVGDVRLHPDLTVEAVAAQIQETLARPHPTLPSPASAPLTPIQALSAHPLIGAKHALEILRLRAGEVPLGHHHQRASEVLHAITAAEQACSSLDEARRALNYIGMVHKDSAVVYLDRAPIAWLATDHPNRVEKCIKHFSLALARIRQVAQVEADRVKANAPAR